MAFTLTTKETDMSNIWYEVYTSCEEDGTETVFTAEDINECFDYRDSNPVLILAWDR